MATADKYEGLTRLQWANRVVEYNDKFDKSALIKYYTARQLGKFQEGGNIQLTKAFDKDKIVKTPAKKTPAKDKDEVQYIKTIKKTPSAPARSGKALEIEKFLRQVAHENGITINFDKCPGGEAKPARKKKPADDLYSDDSDLESCDDEE